MKRYDSRMFVFRILPLLLVHFVAISLTACTGRLQRVQDNPVQAVTGYYPLALASNKLTPGTLVYVESWQPFAAIALCRPETAFRADHVPQTKATGAANGNVQDQRQFEANAAASATKNLQLSVGAQSKTAISVQVRNAQVQAIIVGDGLPGPVESCASALSKFDINSIALVESAYVGDVCWTFTSVDGQALDLVLLQSTVNVNAPISRTSNTTAEACGQSLTWMVSLVKPGDYVGQFVALAKSAGSGPGDGVLYAELKKLASQLKDAQNRLDAQNLLIHQYGISEYGFANSEGTGDGFRRKGFDCVRLDDKDTPSLSDDFICFKRPPP